MMWSVGIPGASLAMWRNRSFRSFTLSASGGAELVRKGCGRRLALRSRRCEMRRSCLERAFARLSSRLFCARINGKLVGRMDSVVGMAAPLIFPALCFFCQACRLDLSQPSIALLPSCPKSAFFLSLLVIVSIHFTVLTTCPLIRLFRRSAPCSLFAERLEQQCCQKYQKVN
ncbi:hypothetical protein IWX50DRAFT_255740 [Phyllosticta citricarpa]